MAKNKERNEIEWFRAKVRALDKKVRALQKENAYLRKREHMLEVIEILAEEPIEEVVKNIVMCPKCDVKMEPKLEFDTKIIYECLNCNDRKSVKK